MLPEFWRERWVEGQIGFHQAQVDAHLSTHWPTLGVPASGRVLVPLCGKSLDLWWLRDQGHDVVGVELSELACQALFDEAGITPWVGPFGPYTAYRTERLTLLQGDVFDLPPDMTFDAAYDRAATVALPTPMRDRYARCVATAVRPGGAALLVTFDYPQQERDGPPFSVPPAEVARLYGDAFAITELARQDAPEAAERFAVSRWSSHVHHLVRR